MDKIFGKNGMLYKGINKMIDLLILNVVFVLTCVPIITIGAAWVSMYQLTLKMIKNEEGYIVRSYMSGLKDNLKKATQAWMIVFTMLFVLGIDFLLVRSFVQPMRQILFPLLFSILLIVIIVASYVFPLMAKFENSLKNTLKNAVIISMSKIMYTIVIVGINIIPFVLFVFGGKVLIYGINFYVLLGFSLSTYINSFFLDYIFKKVFRLEE